MNYSTAILLVSDSVRGIAVSYEPKEKDGETAPLYYFKSLDKNIKVDDLVVIPTSSRHLMTVVKVEEVDVEIPLEDDRDYKWIIGVVDTEAHKDVIRQESEAINKIKKAEKRRRRDELRETLLKDVREEELKAIPIFKD